MTGLDSWLTQFGAGLHGKLSVEGDGDDEDLAPIDRWRRAARRYPLAFAQRCIYVWQFTITLFKRFN